MGSILSVLWALCNWIWEMIHVTCDKFELTWLASHFWLTGAKRSIISVRSRLHPWIGPTGTTVRANSTSTFVFLGTVQPSIWTKDMPVCLAGNMLLLEPHLPSSSKNGQLHPTTTLVLCPVFFKKESRNVHCRCKLQPFGFSGEVRKRSCLGADRTFPTLWWRFPGYFGGWREWYLPQLVHWSLQSKSKRHPLSRNSLASKEASTKTWMDIFRKSTGHSSVCSYQHINEWFPRNPSLDRK